MKLRDLIASRIAALEAEGARLRQQAATYLAAHDAKIAAWRAVAGPLEAHLDSPAKPADTAEAVAKQFAGAR